MFRCHLCQFIAPPRTPSYRLVLERRTKKYPYRSKANTFVRTEAGKRKRFYTDDPGGEGQEVVKEVIVCPKCWKGGSVPT